MKVLFISSIVTNSAVPTKEWTAEYDTGEFPPIGLMYVASYLRKYAPHHEISILDANLLKLTQEDIKNKVLDFKPDVVGMTLLTDILYDSFNTLKMVKEVNKGIRTVVGGAHPNYHIDQTMALPFVDNICLGEGEVVFFEFMKALEEGKDFFGIKGLVYSDNDGNVVRNPGTGYIEDLDKLPHPAFDLLPFNKYYNRIGSGKVTGVICSSRGCPHKCTFCSKLYDNYRGRSPESIIEEMKLYYDNGVREFMFFDDMFNITSKRALDISCAIRENFKDVTWSFRGRADQITDELAKELKRSKCNLVTLGAEAHSDEILKELKTGKNIGVIKRAVNILKENKVKVNTNWIIGLPQHKSKKEIEEMLSVVLEVDSDYVQFSILMLWENTEIFKDAVNKKVVASDVWTNFIKDPVPGFLIPSWQENMTLSELSDILRKCYTGFYLRPKVILRQVMSLTCFSMFVVQFKGFLLMLVPYLFPLISLFRKKNIKKVV